MSGPSETEKANFRSNLYGTLGLAFSTPQAQAENLYAAILEASAALGLNEDRASDDHGPENPSFSDLTREHLRLFVGPGHVQCPPYESVFRKDRPKFERGLVMGPSTADVRRKYALAGLAVSKNYTDLPDHIAAEMEFMHFLCTEESKSRQQGNRQEAERNLNMQRNFLNDHIQPWVEDFANCVIQSTKSAFYKAAANLLLAFTKSEFDYFQESDPS